MRRAPGRRYGYRGGGVKGVVVSSPEYLYSSSSWTINGDTVAELHNQGSAGEGDPDLIQETEAAQPGHYTDADSKNYLRSINAGDYLQSVADILGGATALTLEYVGTLESVSVSQNLLDSDSAVTRPLSVVTFRVDSVLRVVIPAGNYGDVAISYGTTKRHVVIQWDAAGSTNADRLRVWFEGVEQSVSFAGTIENSALATGTALRLFARYDGVNRWPGAVYQLRLWKQLLTEPQIARAYALSAARWAL